MQKPLWPLPMCLLFSVLSRSSLHSSTAGPASVYLESCGLHKPLFLSLCGWMSLFFRSFILRRNGFISMRIEFFQIQQMVEYLYPVISWRNTLDLELNFIAASVMCPSVPKMIILTSFVCINKQNHVHSNAPKIDNVHCRYVQVVFGEILICVSDISPEKNCKKCLCH